MKTTHKISKLIKSIPLRWGAFFVLFTLNGCFEKKVATKSELTKELESRKKVNLLFWGNLNSESDTCSCSLFPLGGIERKVRYLQQKLKQNPQAAVINFGGTFKEPENKKIAKEYKKNEARLIDKEFALPLAALYLNELDLKKLPEVKSKQSCSSCMALNSPQYPKLRIMENSDLSLKVLPLKAATVNDSAESSDPKKPKVDVLINEEDGVLGDTPFQYPQLTKKAINVILGSKTYTGDEIYCESKENTLLCGGSQRGRTVANLEIYYKSPELPFVELSNLRIQINELERLIANKELDKAEALKKKIPFFHDDVEKYNYYTIETVFMNADWADPSDPKPKED